MKRLLVLLVLTASASGAATDPNNARGFGDQVYQMGQLDSINVFNGNLTVRLPIGMRYAVGPMLSYQLILTHNSKVWDYEFVDLTGDPLYPGYKRRAIPERYSNAGLGWTLSLGRLAPPMAATHSTPGHGWIYIAPDGGEHEFASKLRENDPAPTGTDRAFSYTTDGSYLRLRRYPSDISQQQTHFELEFPSGEKHTFDWTGRLTKMQDRYVNNVIITYPIENNVPVWTITDTNGRTQKVIFKSKAAKYNQPNFQYVIDRVELTAFGIATATYSFTYLDDEGTTATSIQRGGCGDAIPHDPSTIDVPVLATVAFPEGLTFAMTHYSSDAAPGAQATCSSGALARLTLPTTGALEWEYRQYEMPFQECGTTPLPEPPTPTWTTEYGGVGRRSHLRPDGTEEDVWAYVPHLTPRIGQTNQSCGGEVVLMNYPPEEFTNTIVSPRGDKTVHYFTVYPPGALAANSVTFKGGEYGLPFTRHHELETGGRALSSRLYDCTTTCTDADIVQSTYVQYEHDGRVLENRHANNRMAKQHIKYNQDAGCNGTCTIDVTNEEFDGYGHFRESTSTSNFPSAPTRTTHSNFNPGATSSGKDANGDEYVATGEPWILGTYDSQWVQQGTSGSKTSATFDPLTGALQSLRRHKGRSSTPATIADSINDLLTVYCRESSRAGQYGYVTSERFFGGDTGTVPTEDLCAITRSEGQFFLTHTYTFHSGTQAPATHQARYTGIIATHVDEEFDKRTGLVENTRDAAGVETSFSFDSLARLTSITPADLATTTYAYANAAYDVDELTPAQLTVTRSDGLIDLTKEEVQFDYLGRRWREKKRMPDGTWSIRQTTYEHESVASASEFQLLTIPDEGTELDFTPGFRTTYTGYDAFSRPATVELPDTKTVATTYDGVRARTTTTSIATGATETDVDTIEEYDHLGQLVKVTQAAGTSGAVPTTYTYDDQGRLSTVTIDPPDREPQSRTFTYHGNGFMEKESHPESGTTTYTYDALGNVTRRHSANGTSLNYTYDAAGRLTAVHDGQSNPLKTLVYDRVSHTDGTTDYSMGKLAAAVRHNYVLGEGVAVTETYTYGGLSGALSRKQTEIGESDITAAETFTDGYAYDELGNTTSITYPTATGGWAEPGRSVTGTYTDGLLTNVSQYTGTITYHPNGMIKTLPHTGGPTWQQTIADGMARPDTISVTDFCTGLSITDQPDDVTINAGENATLVVQTNGATGYQWYKGENILAGDTADTLFLTPEYTAAYWVRATSGTCFVDSNTATVTVLECEPPVSTITAPSTMIASTVATASVPITSGATYVWDISGAEIVSGSGTNSITFRAPCDGTVEVRVTVTTACTSAESRVITVTAPKATVSGTDTIAQGGSATISVAFTGAGRWTYQWSDLATTEETNDEVIERTVTPTGTTTYTVTRLEDVNGCMGTHSGSARITVIPPDAIGVSAQAITPTMVGISWLHNGTADSFTVQRRTTGTYTTIGTSMTPAYSDTSVAPDTAYLYRIIAVRSGTVSNPSDPDLATTTIFTDASLAAGTIIKAVHVTQLRTAVNAVRASAGLSAATFTDMDLTGAAAKAVHAQELRTALDAARAALALDSLTYTDPALTAATIKRAHLIELREGVR